jgi:hypothetical protein
MPVRSLHETCEEMDKHVISLIRFHLTHYVAATNAYICKEFNSLKHTGNYMYHPL